MKILKAASILGLVGLTGLGIVMAVTNPTQTTYERYAVQQLTEYLKKDVCTRGISFLGNSLQAQCVSLVDSSQPQIKQIVARSTQQQNFILFSIYKTDLSLSTLVPTAGLPSYHFETIGVFQTFYTHTAEQR